MTSHDSREVLSLTWSLENLKNSGDPISYKKRKENENQIRVMWDESRKRGCRVPIMDRPPGR